MGRLRGVYDNNYGSKGVGSLGVGSLGCGSTTSSVGSCAGAMEAVFHAVTYDPDTMLMSMQTLGTGTPTATVPDSMWVPDKDGLYQLHPTATPVWKGARDVRTGGIGTVIASSYADETDGGALITNKPWLHYQPALTTSLGRSVNVNYWGQAGSVTRSIYYEDMMGRFNKASILGDNRSDVSEYYFKDAIGSATTRATIRHFFKKVGGTSSFPAGGVTVGTDMAKYQLNRVTGDIIAGSSTTATTHYGRVLSHGDYWLLYIQVDAAGTANIQLHPALGAGASFGTDGIAGNGSVVHAQSEVFLDKSIGDVANSCVIYAPDEAVASVGETLYSWDAGNHSNTQGAYYIEVLNGGGDQEIISIGGTTILYISNGNLILDDGTTTSSTAITIGAHKIGFAYGSSKMRLILDKIWQGEVAYNTFGTGTITTKATIRELKRGESTYSDSQTGLDGWMVT